DDRDDDHQLDEGEASLGPATSFHMWNVGQRVCRGYFWDLRAPAPERAEECHPHSKQIDNHCSTDPARNASEKQNAAGATGGVQGILPRSAVISPRWPAARSARRRAGPCPPCRSACT